MPTLIEKLTAIREARLRLGAAYRILEQAEEGKWDVGVLTTNAIERLCAQGVEHLRGLE